MNALHLPLLILAAAASFCSGASFPQEALIGSSRDKAASSMIDEPVKIGSRLELFVDRFLIESINGSRLQLHRPTPAEFAVKFDNPWEGAFSGYTTVIKDGNVFRMYYRGLPTAGRDGTDTEVTCYAESADGIVWQKPNLGINEINGSLENNVILKGHTPASHNFSPFLDTNPNATVEQRYKALGGTQKGLIAFVSRDGIHWKRIQDSPVFTKGVFDSQNVSFWSEHEQTYVCYFRTWTGKGYKGFRTVSRTTSDDFINWSDPQAMTFGETASEHLYTNQTAPYFRAPHIYLGLAARFMPGRNVISTEAAKQVGVDKRYSHDCSDSVLLSSRGSNHYDRTFMESLLRPGLGDENWVSRSNYAALGIVPTGETEMSIYLSRNYGQPTSYMQRYTLRTDGLASLSAGFDGGEMKTRLLDIAKTSKKLADRANDKEKPRKLDEAVAFRQMILNVSTSAAGSVRVEFQNGQGEAIDGFSLGDCDEIIGDQIERVVTWRGKSDVSNLAKRPFRIRFVLKDADLYSFQFR